MREKWPKLAMDVLMFVILCLLIFDLFLSRQQEQAIKAGVAEYYINENNDKAFRYIAPISAEQEKGE